MDRLILRRLWPGAAVILLLALAVLATARSEPQFSQVAPLTGQGSGDSSPRPRGGSPSPQPTGQAQAADRASSALPAWVGSTVKVIGLLLIATLVVTLAWYGLRDRFRLRVGGATEDDDDDDGVRHAAEDVVAALDEVLVELSDTDRDPRRAVIACWVRLEQAAAGAGTPRNAGDTPTDLITRLLRRHRVSAEVLAGFADIYREARYASHTVDEAMRTQARSSLGRLRAELAAPVRPAGAGSGS